MKALLLSLMLLISPLAASFGEHVYVLSDSCPLYSEPTYSAEQITELDFNEELTLLSDEITNGFYYVSVTIENESQQGYVPAEIVGEKAEGQETILSYNATLLNDAVIYSSIDKSEICTLKKGERVFLYEGYNQKADFLAVRFWHENKITIGLIKTEDVKPDGVNPALIVSICAIVALVTIIFILFGVTKKKRHKKLKS